MLLEKENRREHPLNVRSLCVLFLCILMLSGVYIKSITHLMNGVVGKEEVSLLLLSGQTTQQQATVKIVLWFKSSLTEQQIENVRQMLQKDWEWKESARIGSLNSAWTISGHKLISKEDENEAFLMFQDLSMKAKAYGGVAYFDERITQGIDIANFTVQQGIIPVQWALAENTLSITGLKKEIYPTVRAGKDEVNIQLLSQTSADRGRTVLAIPVLLEEF